MALLCDRPPTALEFIPDREDIGGLSQAAFFNDGKLSAAGVVPNMIGAIVKDPVQDKAVLEEYLETVLKKRPDDAEYYHLLVDLV